MDLLAAGARSLLNLELTSAQLAAFQAYADLLLAWNEKFNLTAIRDLDGIQVKHFLDSLTVLRVLPAHQGAQRVVDVGTGAGFPGLPLKIVRPELRLTLVEATGKKVTFCQAVVDALGLNGVTLIKARAEELGQDPAHREKYDFALARAVAELPVLAEYLLPLLKPGGRAVAQKGEGGPAEALAAAGALRRLGGALEQVVPIALPGIPEPRHLVVLKKISPTAPIYPRRPGVAAKSPLQ
jgi:16S rRNA (guanine527-N7)-methyltransferase